MKRSLITLTAILILASCKNDSGTGKPSKGNDTILTVVADTAFPMAFFIAPDSFSIKNEALGRLTRRIETFVGDSINKKRIESRIDSVYFAFGTQSLFDSNGRPIMDSATGKQKIISGYSIYIPTKNVWDTGIERDSIVKKFNPVLKTPPAINNLKK